MVCKAPTRYGWFAAATLSRSGYEAKNSSPVGCCPETSVGQASNTTKVVSCARAAQSLRDTEGTDMAGLRRGSQYVNVSNGRGQAGAPSSVARLTTCSMGRRPDYNVADANSPTAPSGKMRSMSNGYELGMWL